MDEMKLDDISIVIPSGMAQDDVDSILTEEYLKKYFRKDKSIVQIKAELLQAMSYEYEIHNVNADKGQKWMIPKALKESQIAMIMLNYYEIRLLCFTTEMDPDTSLLVIYDSDEGVYSFKPDFIRNKIREFNHHIDAKGLKEVTQRLIDNAKQVSPCTDRDLIPFNNCIFNYKTKNTEDFSPEKIFLYKLRINYNPLAKNVFITMPDGEVWDVESWFGGLNDDPEVVDLLWKITGAVLRPNVRWDKAFFFFATKGNNGKGTLVQTYRNMLGEKACVDIPLADFDQNFMLEPIIGKSAVITDENNVGQYIDKVAKLKALVTHDVVNVNRKNKTPVSYRFHGVIVECLNEIPRVRDHSDSFARRQCYVPFDKCYTGHERRYIKDDYLTRDDVLEYIAYRILVMTPEYYELPEPESCKNVLDEYKAENDPVIEFWDEVEEQLVYSFIPMELLYSMFRGFYHENFGRKDPIKYGEFRERMFSIIDENAWCYKKKASLSLSSDNLEKYNLLSPEPLLFAYQTRSGNMDKWLPKGMGCLTKIRDVNEWKDSYRHVLIRRTGGADMDEKEGDE